MNHHPATSWFIASSCVALFGALGAAVTAASSTPKSFETVTLIDETVEYPYAPPPANVYAMSHYFDERASAIIQLYKRWEKISTILPAIQNFKGSAGSGLNQDVRRKYTEERNLALKCMMSFYGRVEDYLNRAIQGDSVPTCDQFKRYVIDIMTDVKRQWMDGLPRQ